MDDWMSKLERAKALLEAGALTPEEFEAEKARLLPKTSQSQSQSIGQLHLGVDPSDQSEVDDENETYSSSYNSQARTKIVIAAIIALSIAAIGYFLIGSPSPQPSPNESLEASQATAPAAAKASPEIIEKVPTPKDDRFACRGTFSAVSFSEESGDGSGLYVRIDDAGDIKKWLYYEGGVLHGEVSVESKTREQITASVHYPEYPDEKPSRVVLRCESDKIIVKTDHIDERDRLKRIGAKEATELES